MGAVDNKVYSAAYLGLDGVQLDANRTSNKFPVAGFNNLTVYVNHDAHDALTDLDVVLELSDDDGTTWFPYPHQTDASPSAVTDARWDRASITTTDTWLVRIKDVYGGNARITLQQTAGTTGDTATVSVRASFDGGN